MTCLPMYLGAYTSDHGIRTLCHKADRLQTQWLYVSVVYQYSIQRQFQFMLSTKLDDKRWLFGHLWFFIRGPRENNSMFSINYYGKFGLGLNGFGKWTHLHTEGSIALSSERLSCRTGLGRPVSSSWYDRIGRYSSDNLRPSIYLHAYQLQTIACLTTITGTKTISYSTHFTFLC